MIFTSYDRCQNISGHPVNEDAGSEYVAFMEEMRSSYTVLIWSNHSGDFGVVRNICNKLSEYMV